VCPAPPMDPVFDLCHLVAILPFSFSPRARRSAMNKHLIQVQPQALPPPTKVCSSLPDAAFRPLLLF
jgi:hypothetical protein